MLEVLLVLGLQLSAAEPEVSRANASSTTDVEHVYFFMHIAKTGGQAFADDLGTHKQLGPSAGYVSCGALRGMHVGDRSFTNCSKYLYYKKPGCNFLACEGNFLKNLRLIRGRLAKAANVRTLVLVREPEALLLSI